MIDMLSFDYGKVFISIDLWYKKNRINVYMYSVIRLRNKILGYLLFFLVFWILILFFEIIE